jgi:hypothetical protein
MFIKRVTTPQNSKAESIEPGFAARMWRMNGELRRTKMCGQGVGQPVWESAHQMTAEPALCF